MERMSLANILGLYRARLRARAVLVQEGLAILGIAVGVALLFATQVAGTSLTRSVQALTRQVVGNAQLQVEARGPDGFDERLLGEVRRQPGVRIALPVLEQQANVIGPKGERAVDLIGTDPQFARLGGSVLQRFSAEKLAAQEAIALPAPVAEAVGVISLETLKLQVGARVITTLLGAALHENEVGGLVHSPIALAPVAYAQRMAGLVGRITRIFVQVMPHREAQVRRELTALAVTAGASVEPASFDSTLFATAVAPQSQSEALFSAISALVGFMFALNAMLITVPARRKLLQDIRTQGATRPRVVQILLFDAAVIGAISCVAGLALGELLSITVSAFHTTPGYLSFAFPVGDDRIVTAQTVALAVGAGLAAAVAGVFWPLRDALAPSTSSKTPNATTRWTLARLVLGVACLLTATLILLVDAAAAIIGNVALLVALVCLLPFAFDGFVTLLGRLQRRLPGAMLRMAITDLRTPQTRVRSLAITATAAVAVFGVVEFQGTETNLSSGLDRSARGIDSTADVWVTPGGESNAFATTPFRQIRESALERLPGVRTLEIYRGSFLNWGDRRLWILAPPSGSAGPILAGQIVKGDATGAAAKVNQGGWAVLSQALASEHHLSLGQAFTLPAPQPISMRIAALSSNLGWPPGAIIMDSSDYARAWGSSNPSALQIQTTLTASLAIVRRLVQRTLGTETGLSVETTIERQHRHFALAAQGLSRLTQIRLLVLGAAVLAVTAAMAAMMWQRRDLVAFIKRAGYRRGVLLRWLLCESMIMLVAGCAMGAAFGVFAQLLGSHFLASVTGFPIAFNIEVLAAVSSFALVTTVVAIIVLLPGYLVVRVPPRTVSPAF